MNAAVAMLWKRRRLVTVRVSDLPDVLWRRIEDGVPASKSTFKQVWVLP